MIAQGQGIMRSINGRGQKILTVHLNGRLLGRSPSGTTEAKVVNGGWFVGIKCEMSGVTRTLTLAENTTRAQAREFAEVSLRESMESRGFTEDEWTIQY